MTNEKHTPGPWKAFVRLGVDWEVICVHLEKDVGLHFTEVVAWTGFDSSDIESRDERVANARLIAAAPELFRLLKELTAPFVDIDASGWWCPGCGSTDCTYEGDCTECGFPIENIQPSLELLAQAQSIIAEVTREAT